MGRVAGVLAALAVCAVAGSAGAAEGRPKPSWEKLRAAYNYDASRAPAVREETRADGEYLRVHLTLTQPRGKPVPGLFLRPRAEGVYPCALLLHGLTSDKDGMTLLFGRALAARGVASLALDADRHGERKEAGNPPGFQDVGDIVRGGVREYRTALDYLKTRKDVDSGRIGLFGYSMGAIMGSILAGVDPRVKASVLCVGGDFSGPWMERLPEGRREEAECASPANYAGHISPRPVFFINGRQDTLIPEAAARRLQDAARDPKEVLWADAGHFLPLDALGKGTDWLVRRLGGMPPSRGGSNASR